MKRWCVPGRASGHPLLCSGRHVCPSRGVHICVFMGGIAGISSFLFSGGGTLPTGVLPNNQGSPHLNQTLDFSCKAHKEGQSPDPQSFLEMKALKSPQFFPFKIRSRPPDMLCRPSCPSRGSLPTSLFWVCAWEGKGNPSLRAHKNYRRALTKELSLSHKLS